MPILLTLCFVWLQAAASPVSLVVDNSQMHQTMMGFGATTGAGMAGSTDYLSLAQRSNAVNLVYAQIQLTTGNLEGALLESPGDYSQRQNDNSDPFTINWSGFQTTTADFIKTKLLDLARPLGFTDCYLAQKVNVRWASPWLDSIRATDYNLYLDEAAEQVLAGHLYWKNQMGLTSEFQMLFNEPLSGNTELLNGQTHDVVDLVKRVGARLSQAGFAVKFVMPDEETEEKSLATATAVLSDSAARPYVGAIGYHPYPYGSVYASIPNILSTSGAGNPDPQRIAVRNQLRDLGRQYGLPVWMTEVSNGGVSPLSYDDFRGRAIHIHDELVYADAAAFYGMLNFWDTKAAQDHGLSGDITSSSNEGTLVMVDTLGNGQVYVTGMGYAIGHYARWIKRGAKRIEAASSNPLVQIVAFRDEARSRMVTVMLNNSPTNQSVDLRFNGVSLTGMTSGEQSTAAGYWQPLAPLSQTNANNVVLALPPQSVTSLAVPYAVPAILQVQIQSPSVLRLNLQGGWSQVYNLQTSSNLLDWVNWATITNVGTSSAFTFTNNRAATAFFLRTIQN